MNKAICFAASRPNRNEIKYATEEFVILNDLRTKQEIRDMLSVEIRRIEDKIDRLDEKIDRSFERLDNKIDRSVERLDSKIESISANLGETNKRLDNIERKLFKFGATVAAVITALQLLQLFKIW